MASGISYAEDAEGQAYAQTDVAQTQEQEDVSEGLSLEQEGLISEQADEEASDKNLMPMAAADEVSTQTDGGDVELVSSAVSMTVEFEPTGNASTDTSSIQSALNKALATEERVLVVLKGGMFTINGTLRIFSNTELRLDSATVLRASGLNAPMLMTTRDKNGNQPGGYARAKDITVTGGTWDSAKNPNTHCNVMHFAHAQNITVSNTTIKNCSASHAMILDALKDSIVSGVTFKDDVADASIHPGDTRFANEAVHIDAATGDDAAPGAEPFDDTNSQNVTVTRCTFDNVVTCAGSHRHGTTQVDNTGIVISNNTVVKVEKGATIFNAVRTPGIKITGNVAKSTGAAYFVRFHGSKNFMVSGNTVDGISQFAYAYVMTDCDWKSSGTLSNNTVTGITGNGLKAYNVGGTIKLSGEKYSLNVFNGTMLAHNAATTVTTDKCTFNYPTISKIADQTYLGKTKEIKPGVTVKVGSTTLKNGTDYTVSYSNNKAVGTATVTVTGKGAYSGSATTTFRIFYKKPGWSGATQMPLNSTADYSVTNGGYIRLKNSSGAYVTSNSVVSLSAPSSTVKRVTAKGVGTTTIYLLDPDGRQCGSKTVKVTKLSGNYELESVIQAGLVLDIQGNSPKNSARMIVWTRNNAPNQRYQFIAQKDGSYQIKCVHSGLAVDVKGGGTEKSQPVIQYTWKGGTNQKWRITVDKNNYVTFVNAKSGMVFDVQGGKAVKGAKMIQYPGNGGNNQKWKLNKK